MTTIRQSRVQYSKRKRKNRTAHLQKCPQKKGICRTVFILTPRKPNSAKRKVIRIFLISTKKILFAYIPGIGHNIQKFSQILIRGGLIRDLPGVHYTVIRGVLDAHPVFQRRSSRSKYGMKKHLIG